MWDHIPMFHSVSCSDQLDSFYDVVLPDDGAGWACQTDEQSWVSEKLFIRGQVLLSQMHIEAHVKLMTAARSLSDYGKVMETQRVSVLCLCKSIIR